MSREADPQGTSTGEFGVQMRTRDMARLTLLYLRGGEWNGRQLVSRDWVARVFAPTVSMGLRLRAMPTSGGACRSGEGTAVGFHRQILLVMPRHGIAAAFTGRKHWAFAPRMDLLDPGQNSFCRFQPALPARPVPLLRDECKLQPSAAWVPTTTDCGPSPAGCEIRSSMMKVR